MQVATQYSRLNWRDLEANGATSEHFSIYDSMIKYDGVH
jgi:hypothetical protein